MNHLLRPLRNDLWHSAHHSLPTDAILRLCASLASLTRDIWAVVSRAHDRQTSALSTLPGKQFADPQCWTARSDGLTVASQGAGAAGALRR